MPASEMHALEKAALDDPFLADAMEGVAGIRQVAIQEDLDQLQKRLEHRVAAQKSNRFLPLMKAAAIFVLVAGLGVTTWYLLEGKAKQSTLAKAEQKAAQEPAVPPPAAADSAVRRSDTAVSQESLAYANKPASGMVADSIVYHKKASGQEPRLAKKSRKAVQLWASDEDTILIDSSPSLYKTSPIQQETKVQRSTAAAAPYYNNNLRNNQALNFSNTFSGRVVDASNNNPLPGATLRFKGNNNIGTTTDRFGNFSLQLPPSDTTGNLSAAFVGYAAADMNLSPDNRAGNVIQLKPLNSSLDEVVVVGLGVKRREVLRTDTVMDEDTEKTIQKDLAEQRAIPSIGWDNYNHYLSTHKNAAGLDSTLKGSETIVFRVHENGKLSNFHAEQSLSSAHDAAIIQLIQQGPRWKLSKGKRAWASVTVDF